MFIDLTGKRFGRLLVVERAGTSKRRRALWLAACDCGVRIAVITATLQNGRTKSCGCLHREVMREVGKWANTKHGEAANGKLSPEYSTWRSMIQRCEDPRHNRYDRYGGRGIRVCDRWRNSFEAFLADMGRKPSSNLSIDRINNDGNYEPGNCRWATASEQQKNKSKPNRRAA
jgi:hypothetical protein